jgi:N-acetylmuramoyl-L-alanine amidase
VADEALAAAIQARVVATLAEAGYTTLDRGVKSDLAAGKPYGHFFGLRGPMPSALLEALFLTSPDEAALLNDETVREAIARGCAQGILEYLAAAGE